MTLAILLVLVRLLTRALVALPATATQVADPLEARLCATTHLPALGTTILVTGDSKHLLCFVRDICSGPFGYDLLDVHPPLIRFVPHLHSSTGLFL